MGESALDSDRDAFFPFQALKSSADDDSTQLMLVPMESHTRGALIVIEGLDRAGKSTQCDRLYQALEQQGHSVKHMRFPSMDLIILRVD